MVLSILHMNRFANRMHNLIALNMLWNCLFVIAALSELIGLTAIHGALPWYAKWIWLVLLASGNLFVHILMIRSFVLLIKR